MSRTRTPAITAWDIGAPADWAALPLEPLDRPETRQRIREAAEELADGEGARRLERFLLAAQPGLLDDPLVLLAVWVPDREAGIPQGVLKVELLTDADLETFESMVTHAAPLPGQERLHLEVLRTELPAGPAVVVDHQGAVDGVVEQYLQLCVFPPGTTDAVSLGFATTALHLVEDLALAARTIAESLVVRLGEEHDR